MGILRLSHVDVRVPDLDLATAYYTEVMGLLEVERTATEVFLKCWDEDRPPLGQLSYDPRVGMDLISFKVEHDDDLAELESRVERYGFPVRRVSRGEAVGQGESIRFETPSGQMMELVRDVEKVGGLLPKLNPPPFPPQDLPGIAPPRIDHVLVTAEEVGEATRFYMEVLGFRLTEQLLDGNGHQIGVWMERSHSPARPRHRHRGQRRRCTTSRSGSTTGTTSARRPTSWPTTASRSTSARPATASPAATPSTSSTRWAPATRCSPAATGPTRTSRPSPGPRTTSAGRSSTTRATSTSGS